jgi:glucosamine--fructose-6-phosphate aminotransferase (isomerizing)
LAEDAYVVASEPYGLVEETTRYLRMDGETPGNAENPNASRGQVLVLDGDEAGTIAGIERMAYDGTPLPVAENDLVTAQVTTRDIDRGSYPHFLLKEISESPASFRKTLRGKLLEVDGRIELAIGPEALPDDVRRDLASGAISRVVAIGQGRRRAVHVRRSRRGDVRRFDQGVLLADRRGFPAGGRDRRAGRRRPRP